MSFASGSTRSGTARAWWWRLRHLEPPLWMLALLAAGPLGLQAAQAAPPWPGGVAQLTSLSTVGLALGLGRWRAQHTGALGPRVRLAAALMVAVGALVFLLLLSRFVFTIPSTGEPGVKGFVCTPEARLVYTLTCPEDDLEALRSAEYESTRIWQAWTVDVVRLALLVSWAAAWSGLCLLAAAMTRAPFRVLIERAPPVTDAADSYFFISYAHADLQGMLPVLDRLHEQGYPLWFDKGLLGGQDWDTGLARRVHGCRALVLFLSPASVASQWVEREVRLADELGKPIFAVRIGDAALTPAMQLRIPATQVIEGSDEQIVLQFQRAFAAAPTAGLQG